MSKNTSRRGRWHWLLPLCFALPFAIAAAYALIVWGPTIRDYFSIAVKMAVIS